jgi:multicomponent Na+:H+ antiporter subunit E
MSWFLAHILFSLLWAALLGAFDFLTLLSGFALGLGLFRITLNQPTFAYRHRVYALVRFALFYIKEILSSNLRIATDILRGKPKIQPGIVAIRVDALSPRATVLVANLITMTPGTLSLDISDDDAFLYVHCLYLDDPEAVRDSMQRDYVDNILALQKPIHA